jgi:hypothetical protein
VFGLCDEIALETLDVPTTLEKRRKLIEAWAVYCEAPKSSKVVTFQRTFRTRR